MIVCDRLDSRAALFGTRFWPRQDKRTSAVLFVFSTYETIIYMQTIHHDIDRVLISREQIHAKISELSDHIVRDYADVEDLLLIGVLKGCVMFMVDLARALPIPVSLDFIATSSYGASSESSGVVRLLKDLESDITGRHVLIVEDIIDSGLTLGYLHNLLLHREPASIRICALLNKPERRVADVSVDYLGFDIPNEFVVGYGLDFNEHYRNLDYIGVLNPSIYRAQPPTLNTP